MPSSPTSVMRLHLAERAITATGGHPLPRRFLDVGTGEGEFLVRLFRKGYEGVSVDVSEEALKRARAQLDAAGAGSIKTEHASLYELTGAWPLVLCFEVLEHLDDDESAMVQLTRLVESGGRLVVTVPARPELWGPSDDLTGHVRRYTREELAGKLTAAGLSVELVWSVGIPLANVLTWLRRQTLRRSTEPSPDGMERVSRTEQSSFARSYGIPESWWKVLFNRVTLLPFLWLQRAFVASPRGGGLIAVARRAGKRRGRSLPRLAPGSPRAGRRRH